MLAPYCGIYKMFNKPWGVSGAGSNMNFFETHAEKISSFAKHLLVNEGDRDELGLALKKYLLSIAAAPSSYDRTCSLITKWRGDEFLIFISPPTEPEEIGRVSLFIGLAIHERYLRTGEYIPGSEEFLLKYFSEHNSSLDVDTRELISRIKSKLILEIAKESYGRAERSGEATVNAIEQAKSAINEGIIKTLQNTEGASNLLKKKIEGWEEYLNRQEGLVKNIKSNYNFVGLSKGFHDIEKSKRSSRRWVLSILVVMGVATMGMPIWAFFHNVKYAPEVGLEWIGDFDHMLKIAPFIIPIEIITIYYFRIILKNFQSMTAQIVQLELRQALCAFIESYVEYKKGFGKDVSIDRFEEIIFSGITMEPGQIPQTFDGLEKLAGAINAIKSKTSG